MYTWTHEETMYTWTHEEKGFIKKKSIEKGVVTMQLGLLSGNPLSSAYLLHFHLDMVKVDHVVGVEFLTIPAIYRQH